MTRRALLALPALAVVARAEINVRAEGAAGDGAKLDTASIQAAIDKIAASGGGSVVFPPGRYLSGTIFLRDRTTLHLERGAILQGSPNLNDYTQKPDPIVSYTSNYTDRCLIRADSISDTGITGSGVIDGNGQAFTGDYKRRPYTLRFINSRGITVSGITLTNSAMWVQHYLDCEDVLIDGVRVRSRRERVNNDGIDIDSCRRVRITNCDIDAGDDAIVLKATTSKPCRDIVVSNCILTSLCNAFKLGTESNGGFDNIVATNLAIHDTKLAGIALETVDGGPLTRVSISNIVMRDVACPFFFRLGNRARKIAPDQPQPGIATMSGITLRGIQATATSPIGCSIVGLKGHPIEDVALDDIRLTMPGNGNPAEVPPEFPEKADVYPEFNMFGLLPAYGIYIRHAKGITLQRIRIRSSKYDPRQALVANDVQDLTNYQS